MAIENNIIKPPVQLVADVAKVLKANTYSLGNLCQHPNINMWSKYKPVQSEKVSLWSRDAEGKLVPDTTEWMKVRYGLANKITTMSITEVFNKDNVWGYNRPNGGTSQPFRLGDFIGYYHDAVQPFGFGWPTEMKCESETSDYFVVSCFYDKACMAFGWRADGCLNFRDCFLENSQITDRYFTVVMRAWNSKTQTYRDLWFMMSAEKSIGENLAYSNPVSLVQIP